MWRALSWRRAVRVSRNASGAWSDNSRTPCTKPRRIHLFRVSGSPGAYSCTSQPLLGVLSVSLALGMWGYEYFEHLPWRDAFLNAAMLMGGMGPVDAPRTNNGKVFAGLYALYAGLVFLAAAGLVFAPILHRVLHRFHWKQDR